VAPERGCQARLFAISYPVFARSLFDDRSDIGKIRMGYFRKEMMGDMQRQSAAEGIEPAALRHDVQIGVESMLSARRVKAAVRAEPREQVAVRDVSELEGKAHEQSRDQVKCQQAQDNFPPMHPHNAQGKQKSPRQSECLEAEGNGDLASGSWTSRAKSEAILRHSRIVEDEPFMDGG